MVADVAATASGGGPDTVGPGSPHSAINGSDMPTTAGGTGAIEIDRFGNNIAELASSRNSHGGGRRPARIVALPEFRRGEFFVRGFDAYDGLMSDFKRVVSVFASGMAGGSHRGPVHSGTGASSRAPKPVDGKRRLIRGEGLVARIRHDYRLQLPVVGEDIPGPAVPCHVGTARELEMVNQRTRMDGRAVRRPYSDSDDLDNYVLHAEEHDSAVRQVSLRNKWSVDSRTADNSCGEGCAQLDDCNWFLRPDDRVGDLPAPESEVDVSDSESEVDYIESDSAPLRITMTAVELLCPPVVAQTRPMEGRDPDSPRRLRRGRDVLTEDGTVAVDTRQVSAASDTVVVSGIHMMPECFPTVTPKLAAAPQAASEVDQTRSRGYCCMNLLPPVGEFQGRQ